MDFVLQRAVRTQHEVEARTLCLLPSTDNWMIKSHLKKAKRTSILGVIALLSHADPLKCAPVYVFITKQSNHSHHKEPC